MDKKLRIDELVEKLNTASNAYYGAGEEVLSNYEWDAMFDELASLETETGYIRDDSPTQTVSSTDEVIEGGEKERHEFPALSLQKSKKVPDIVKWAGARDIWCALKLDGCTCVATYDAANDGTGDSVLTKFLTRGAVSSAPISPIWSRPSSACLGESRMVGMSSFAAKRSSETMTLSS